MDLGNAMEKLKQIMSTDEGQAKVQNIMSNFSSNGIDTSNLGNILSNMNAGNSTNESDFGGSNTEDDSSAADNSGGFDPEMMQKMFSMMNSGGGNGGTGNRHSTMLNSLKPYLSDGRRGKLDMASKLMSFAKFAPMMKDMM